MEGLVNAPVKLPLPVSVSCALLSPTFNTVIFPEVSTVNPGLIKPVADCRGSIVKGLTRLAMF